MNTLNVMIDLETLGTQAGCVIAQIAAVAFDEDGLQDDISLRIDLEDAQRAGLVIEAGTVRWWLTHDTAQGARGLFAPEGALPLRPALELLSGWLRPLEPETIWCKGASFDFPILAAAYHAVGLELPWKYRDERCLRTLAALAPAVLLPRAQQAHDALADALAQAEQASKILRTMRAFQQHLHQKFAEAHT